MPLLPLTFLRRRSQCPKAVSFEILAEIFTGKMQKFWLRNRAKDPE